MDLHSLGAHPGLHGAFQTYALQGLTLARVALAQRDQYQLFSAAGKSPRARRISP